MTIDKLAMITQQEFTAVRKDMDAGLTAVRKDMDAGLTAVRKDMDAGLTAVRTEMAMNFQDFEIKITEKMKEETVTILQAFDKFAVGLDTKEKEEAAHAMSHKRISDTLYDHDLRLKKVEMKN